MAQYKYDWSQDTIGQPPADTTVLDEWGGVTATVEEVDGKRALRVALPPDDAGTYLRLDAPGVSVEDIEMLVKLRLRLQDPLGQENLWLSADVRQVSFGSYYSAALFPQEESVFVLDSATDELGAVVVSVDDIKPIWLRIRAEGSTISAAYGQGDSPPDTWDIQVSDSAYGSGAAAVYISIWDHTATAYVDVEYIGIGTDGDPAPMPPDLIAADLVGEAVIEANPSTTAAGGMWVAVGTGGTIRTSTNGISWTSRASGTTSNLNGIAYGDGMWVAVSTGGTIRTSTDGISWTSRASGTTQTLFGIAYGDGMWVAVGNSGTILTSPDGITWTSRTSGTADTLYDVAYGGGMWVVVGLNGTILTSADGVTWTSRSGATRTLQGIAYGGGMWVAVGWNGTILTSADGVTWTSRTSGTMQDLRGIAYDGGTWVAVGNSGTILTSPDGVTWTSRTSGVSVVLNRVAYGGMWVAVGNSGTILTSLDGITWTGRTSGTTQDLRGIASDAPMPPDLIAADLVGEAVIEANPSTTSHISAELVGEAAIEANARPLGGALVERLEEGDDFEQGVLDGVVVEGGALILKPEDDDPVQYITSGYRISPPLSLEYVGTAVDSRIYWRSTEPPGTSVTIEASWDDGNTWVHCTNGQPVPGLVGDVADKQLLVKATLSTVDPELTPLLRRLHVKVAPYQITPVQVAADIKCEALLEANMIVGISGYRIAPAIDLDDFEGISEATIEWQATTPARTSVLIYSYVGEAAPDPDSELWVPLANLDTIPNVAGAAPGSKLFILQRLLSQDNTISPALEILKVSMKLTAMGYRIAPAISLDLIKNLAVSGIEWEADEPAGSKVEIFASVDEGNTWYPCPVNGGAIGGLLPGMSLVGRNLLIRSTLWATTDNRPILKALNLYAMDEADDVIVFTTAGEIKPLKLLYDSNSEFPLLAPTRDMVEDKDVDGLVDFGAEFGAPTILLRGQTDEFDNPRERREFRSGVAGRLRPFFARKGRLIRGFDPMRQTWVWLAEKPESEEQALFTRFTIPLRAEPYWEAVLDREIILTHTTNVTVEFTVKGNMPTPFALELPGSYGGAKMVVRVNGIDIQWEDVTIQPNDKLVVDTGLQIARVGNKNVIQKFAGPDDGVLIFPLLQPGKNAVRVMQRPSFHHPITIRWRDRWA